MDEAVNPSVEKEGLRLSYIVVTGLHIDPTAALEESRLKGKDPMRNGRSGPLLTVQHRPSNSNLGFRLVMMASLFPH